MSKRKEPKQVWCIICKEHVLKSLAMPVYNQSPIRHCCKSHPTRYDPTTKYILNKNGKIVEGVTRPVIKEEKRVEMSPREAAIKLRRVFDRLDRLELMRRRGY